MRRILALFAVLAGCSLGDPGSPELRSPQTLPAYLPQRLRRLSARELVQSIADGTGVEVTEARVAPLVARRKFDNGDPDAWVTSDVLFAIEELAWFVADEVASTRPARVFGTCEGAEACKVQLLDVALPRIYRRRLSSAEEASYASLLHASGGKIEDGVRAVFAAALQSPAFLYREEIGQPEAVDMTVFVLRPEEIAAQLSFLVTGSLPDDELLEAARSSRLLDPEERLSQVTRLLHTPAAVALRRHFLELYLAAVEVREIRKSEAVYPGFREGEALGQDLRAMLDDVVREGGSTRQLLSSPHVVAEPLRATYGRGPLIQGALMHPAFLTTHGGFENSNPIARGLFVLDSLLCAPPAPPPPGIPRVPSDASEITTTRQKFAGHSQGGCQSCHRAIDGIGFGFEQFDGIGRFRDTENGRPVDATGLAPMDGTEIPYDGLTALTASLAASQQVASCYAKHVVRFALGAGERVEDARLYEALAKESTPDTTLEAHIRRVVASDTFIRRRAP